MTFIYFHNLSINDLNIHNIKMKSHMKIVFVLLPGLFLIGGSTQLVKKGKKEALKVTDFENLSIRYEPITGIGPEENVVRRDPSDIIFAKGLYYVWYTKLTNENYNYPEGHQGNIWYATSPDGINWKEKQKVLGTSEEGNFDDFGVCTPNIIFSLKDKHYYLYYKGVQWLPEDSGRIAFSGGAIGVAIAEGPGGGTTGWLRGNGGKPVLRTMEQITQNKFGSRHVDDVCMLFKNGKYYIQVPSLYYWAREARNSNAEIDYIIPCCSSALPIEVKAGKTGTLRSMHIYLKKYSLPAGVRISQLFFNKNLTIVSLPFYAIRKIHQLLKSFI
ncbi:hypothetical protein ES705_25576 [subsurface metagenome]